MMMLIKPDERQGFWNYFIAKDSFQKSKKHFHSFGFEELKEV